MIRAILILSTSREFVVIKEKDRITVSLLNNIINGKFDFKKANVLASFAESITEYLSTILNLEGNAF